GRHRVVVVHEDFLYEARDLGADLDGRNRLEVTRGGDGLGDVGATDLGGNEGGGRSGIALGKIVTAANDSGDDHENQPEFRGTGGRHGEGLKREAVKRENDAHAAHADGRRGEN